MKKYVSRTKNRAALILIFAFVVLLFVGYIFQKGRLMLISLLPFAIASALMISTNRCPNCGEYFRGLYWAKSNAGHCKKCGKIIEFDDRDKANRGRLFRS